MPRDPYYERYEISRLSGQYKQCKSAADRAQCRCPSEALIFSKQSVSHFRPVDFSDCISVVRTVHFSSAFRPDLWIVSDAVNNQLQQPYTLEELNGRTDYCVNTSATSSAGICADEGRTQNLRFVPSQWDSIVWKGGGLYHFRATVHHDPFCTLSTEFILFVDAVSMQTSTQYLVMSSTAMACLLAMLGVYVFHFSAHQLGEG